MITAEIYTKSLSGNTHKINDFEVAGVRQDKDGTCERLEEDEEQQANFFSVYVHFKDRGTECIADCKTKQDAEQLAALLQNIVDNYENTQE